MEIPQQIQISLCGFTSCYVSLFESQVFSRGVVHRAEIFFTILCCNSLYILQNQYKQLWKFSHTAFHLPIAPAGRNTQLFMGVKGIDLYTQLGISQCIFPVRTIHSVANELYCRLLSDIYQVTHTKHSQKHRLRVGITLINSWQKERNDCHIMKDGD